MNLKTVLLELSPTEVQRALAIALDDDAVEALAFVQGLLVKRIEKALQRH